VDKGAETHLKRRERVAMLVALPRDVWNRIRAEANDAGVGPSRLIEPILLQAFDCGTNPNLDSVEDTRGGHPS
jgi:hypothetical protein